jgi:hypothetical protein
MNELTLESLAKRIEALEAELSEVKGRLKPRGWESVAGMFEGSEFMRQVDEEGRAIREAEREEARRREKAG